MRGEARGTEPQSCDLFLSAMHTPRHYRGGYQFVSLAALRVLSFPNERVLNEVEFVLDEIATCLTNSQLSDNGRLRE